MRGLSTRSAVLAVVSLLALAAVSSQAFASAHRPPRAAAAANATATLTASIDDSDLATIVYFQYGATTSYGSASASLTLNALLFSATVSITVGGLNPGSTYHYRVIAQNLLGTTYGPDLTFKIAGSGSVGSGTVTVGTPTTVSATGGSGTGVSVGGSTGSGTGTSSGGSTSAGSVSVGAGSSPSGPATGATGATGASGATGATGASGQGDSGGSSTAGGGDNSSSGAASAAPGGSSAGTAPAPRLLHTAVVADTTGVVLAQAPGAAAPSAVATQVDVPSGTLIDAHAGVVNLTTALDTHGHTQTVMLWGGSFRLRYARGETGRVVLSLAGGDFAACAAPRRAGPVARAARTAARPTRSSHVVRSLWSSDNHGRYTTQGNDSVATVQGTVWLTEDRCDGTLTRVARGAVLVRDLRAHRVVRVAAGESYLAPRGG